MNDFIDRVRANMFNRPSQPVSDLGIVQRFIDDKFERFTQSSMEMDIRLLSKMLVLIKQGDKEMATLQATLDLVQKMFDEVTAAHGVIGANADALAAKDKAIADLTAKDAQDVADKNAALDSASSAKASLAGLQAKVDSGELVSSADVTALSDKLIALEAQLSSLVSQPVILTPNPDLAPVAAQDPAPVEAPPAPPADVPVDPSTVVVPTPADPVPPVDPAPVV
jgi:hypothetical protein